VTGYSAWLEQEPLPKLLIAGQPGAVLRGELLDYCRTWPSQAEVTVNGPHFLPEDSPDQIGAAIAGWLVRWP
jgi:haloalkane dehalogenase